MPIVTEGREPKRGRRRVAALAVVGLLIALPAGMLLAALTVPLPRPVSMPLPYRHLVLYGVDEPASPESPFPQGFSLQRSIWGNRLWMFRCGRRYWYVVD